MEMPRYRPTKQSLTDAQYLKDQLDAGLDHKRRQPRVTEAQFCQNWCDTFGHRYRASRCITCGQPQQGEVCESSGQ